MDVLHTNNNCRGQSDVLRRLFKSGPIFVHSLTSALPLQITVASSNFQTLQPALPRRQFKSKPSHLHSLTLHKANLITSARITLCVGLQNSNISALTLHRFQAQETIMQTHKIAHDLKCLTSGSNRSLRSLGLAKASPLTKR